MSSFRMLVMAAVVVSMGSVMSSEASANSIAKIEPTCCGPVAPEPCCYTPCISYKTHRLFTKKACPCDCAPPVEMILQVVDPRCNCYVDVPVCVPACCVDMMPEVDSRCAIFKRGIVEYTWCCGYKIKVVFAGHDKVNVHYYGL